MEIKSPPPFCLYCRLSSTLSSNSRRTYRKFDPFFSFLLFLTLFILTQKKKIALSVVVFFLNLRGAREHETNLDNFWWKAPIASWQNLLKCFRCDFWKMFWLKVFGLGFFFWVRCMIVKDILVNIAVNIVVKLTLWPSNMALTRYRYRLLHMFQLISEVSPC